MTAAIAILLLGHQGPLEIQFSQDAFLISGGSKPLRVPLQETVEAPKLGVFRRGNVWVVWDERGLTVRDGDWSKTTKLEDAATSPKLFSREQILETVALVERAIRSKGASRLSGARRFGDRVYLLARWEDNSKRPWLEALFSVDLTDIRPQPQVIGRFEGYSLADRTSDDRLMILDDKLALITSNGQSWGLAKFDPKDWSFGYTALGGTLTSYVPINQRLGIFTERTSYGVTSVGRVDLIAGFRRTLFETRTEATPIDTSDPLIFLLKGRGVAALRNSETGAEVKVPAGAAARRTDLGVLVWSPAKKPTWAALYDPARWEIKAKL